MIEAFEISKCFGDNKILSNVTLRIEKEKSFVILGQSGIGKSVFLKILARLIYPDHGRVFIQSTNVGMLFQQNALFDSMTVSENLDFPLREKTNLSKKQRKEKIEKYLSSVKLSNAFSLFPSELSGGMQKRLGIARALIVEPEVVLYDEPTAGLDPITSRMIVDLILNLKKEVKSTIISVTSDLLRAYQLADEIAFLFPTPNGAESFYVGSPEMVRTSSDFRVQKFLRGGQPRVD